MTVTTSPTTNDILYTGDFDLRYLGHSKAKYGFILVAPLLEEQFIFDINPQSIETDEPFATVITPTPGDFFTEKQGILLKDIVISGHTGFLPRKGIDKSIAARTFYALGRLTEAENALAKRAYAGVSGYDSFMRLRSLFRHYGDIHRNASDEIRAQTRLYWVNMKDNEIWLVEPISFHGARAVPRTMVYSYNIRITTLAKGAGAFSPVPGDFSDFKLGSVSVLSAIRNRIDDANILLQRGMGLLDSFRTIQSQISSILSVGSTISEAINNLASGAKEFLDFPASLFAQITTGVTSIYQSAGDLAIDLPVDVLEGLCTLEQEYDNLGARLNLFAPPWQAKWNHAIADFNQSYGIQGDVKAELAVGLTRNALGEATPQRGEDMPQFANRILGDASRWQEIVALNELTWPYFSPTADSRMAGTVAPGDPLLVPLVGAAKNYDNMVGATAGIPGPSFSDDVASAAPLTLTKVDAQAWRPNEWVGFTVEITSGLGIGQTRLVTANTSTTLTLDLVWSILPNATSVFKLYFKTFESVSRKGVEESLGSDVQLVYDSTRKLWTFAINASGDIQTIQGMSNLSQALDIKLRTDQGTLVLYPWFGLRPLTGTAGTPENLIKSRLYYEETILSDSRIESITKLSFELIQDVLTISAELLLKGGARSVYTSPMM